MNLQLGSTLQGGKYKIEKILGQGGFGITYLAEQKVIVKGDIGEIETNIKVTIKEFFMKELCNRDADTSIVTVPSVGSKELVDRFKQKFVKEAQHISKLKHNNIIKVLDIFEENGTAYYIMEFVNGGSLNDRVSQDGKLDEREARHYICQIADALGYIHSKKINHLDVKPANILLKEGAVAVLIDFGLAKQYDKKGDQTSATPVGISKGYAPIEQYKTGGVSSFSPATDIYSLGATLYKLVTGKVPPEAHDIFESGLPELPKELSESLKNAIVAALKPSLANRPQTIQAFLDILGKEASSNISDDDDDDEDDATEIIGLKPKAPEPTKKVEPTKKTNTSGKKSKAKVILMSILGVFVAFIVLIFAIGGSEDSPKEDRSSNYETEAQGNTTDPVAQFEIGYNYHFGEEGMPVDYEEAVKWYRKSAEQGYVYAQYFLGVCYDNGLGVEDNSQEAVKWYRKAAEQGDADAQYDLGICYSTGDGVSADDNEATKWFLKSARQGNAEAQYNIGICYDEGIGVEQSYEIAAEWYLKSAEQGNIEAQNNIAYCYYKGEGVAQDINEAKKWYSKAAEQGSESAIENLKIINEQ